MLIIATILSRFCGLRRSVIRGWCPLVRNILINTMIHVINFFIYITDTQTRIPLRLRATPPGSEPTLPHVIRPLSLISRRSAATPSRRTHSTALALTLGPMLMFTPTREMFRLQKLEPRLMIYPLGSPPCTSVVRFHSFFYVPSENNDFFSTGAFWSAPVTGTDSKVRDWTLFTWT
jgi:hypothetical protein